MTAQVSHEDSSVEVDLALEEGYRFRVDLGAGEQTLVMDEPPPLGEDAGPNAARMLAAAVGNCLSASLLFCLRRARVDVRAVRTTARASLVRNERGRLRVGEIRCPSVRRSLAIGARSIGASGCSRTSAWSPRASVEDSR